MQGLCVDDFCPLLPTRRGLLHVHPRVVSSERMSEALLIASGLAFVGGLVSLLMSLPACGARKSEFDLAGGACLLAGPAGTQRWPPLRQESRWAHRRVRP